MKKIMFVIILALVGVIMYQGGCFMDVDLYYGSKIIKILNEDPMDPIIKALEGNSNE